jgi:hypothetical protein
MDYINKRVGISGISGPDSPVKMRNKLKLNIGLFQMTHFGMGKNS